MILLDTCTLLWLASDHDSLSEKAISTIVKNQGLLCVSAISAFEIAMKVKKKKLKLKKDPLEWFNLAISLHGIIEVSLTSKILAKSVALPKHHQDPADRIIVATAAINQFPIVTPDAFIKKYRGVSVVW